MLNLSTFLYPSSYLLMDSEKAASIKFYNSLDKKENTAPNSIYRLFERNDYYNIYGSNAEEFATTFSQSRESLSTITDGSESTYSTYISNAKWKQSISHILLTLRKPIFIYRKPKGGSKDSIEWHREDVIYPGDLSYVSDSIDPQSTPITLAVSFSMIEKKVEGNKYDRLMDDACDNNTNMETYIQCDVVKYNSTMASIEVLSFQDLPTIPQLRALFLQQQPSHVIIYSNYYNPELYPNTKQYSTYKPTCPAAQSLIDLIEHQLLLSNAYVVHAPLYSDRMSMSRITSIIERFEHSNPPQQQQQPAQPNQSREKLTTMLQESPVQLGMTVSLLQYFGLIPNDKLDHLYTPHTTLNNTLFSFDTFNIHNALRIDYNTLSSLGILPSPADSHKSMSLLGLLNTTITASGSRLLNEWIRSPLVDIQQINTRHHIVECFVNSSHLLSSFRQHLKGLADIDRLLSKLTRIHDAQTMKPEYSSIVIKDLVQLYHFSSKLVSISSLLATELSTGSLSSLQCDITTSIDINNIDNINLKTINSLEISPPDLLRIKYSRILAQYSDELTVFEKLISSTIDFAALQNYEYIINASLNEDLTQLETKKQKIKRALDRQHQSIADDLGIDMTRIKLNYVTSHGYYVRLTRKDEKLIRNNNKYILLETRKDGIRFTNSNIQALSREYDHVLTQYNEIQKNTVQSVLGIAVTYFTVFYDIQQIISELDVLSSFAYCALTAPSAYIRPQMRSHDGTVIGPQQLSLQSSTYYNTVTSSDSIQQQQQQQSSNSHSRGHILLRDARHPCLEVQPGVSFIPNDLELVHGKSELHLITGPNMGGKSTYIRSVALIILMAQIGSYVPCTGAIITLVDCLLARVGAGDSQLRGVSTFMKEMIETGEILKYATSNSLIIIDELGRGTSTYDGFGLAWGIAEYLASHVHAYTLFATHFHEMTALSEQLPIVTNKHVTALTSDNAITMLYKIKPGHCDRSFGIHVAQLANFPSIVVDIARKKAQELELFSDEDISHVSLPRSLGSSLSSSSSSSSSTTATTDMVDISSLTITDQQATQLLQQLFNNTDLQQYISTHNISSDNDQNERSSSLPSAALISSYDTIMSSLVQQ